LYNQVNNELRLDIKSPESDRWNPDRQWQVRILKDESDIAFTIPGGDLYISSGLLKKLRFEADLYYILAVEAIIVQDQHLLEGLIEYYTITPLLELGQTDMDIENRFTDIHQVIAEMSYDAEAIQEIQYEAEALICRSSLYDPSVYASFSKELMPTSQWLTNRRLSLISSAQEPCGDLKTNGSYSEQVLEKLD
ncbi:MAG: hypothetical protein KJP00_14365, partial [Bacteroidia bacterium]|nr:hypothetical protein [Bacteroidia bacterium]